MSNVKKLDSTNAIIAELKNNTDTIQSWLTSLETEVTQTQTEVEEIKTNGVTTETVTNTVESKINTMLSDGSLANMTIENNSITTEKLGTDVLDYIDNKSIQHV